MRESVNYLNSHELSEKVSCCISLRSISLPARQCAYLVQMLQGQDDLSDVDPHLVFSELFPLVQVSEQLSSAHII